MFIHFSYEIVDREKDWTSQHESAQEGNIHLRNLSVNMAQKEEDAPGP